MNLTTVVLFFFNNYAHLLLLLDLSFIHDLLDILSIIESYQKIYTLFSLLII